MSRIQHNLEVIQLYFTVFMVRKLPNVLISLKLKKKARSLNQHFHGVSIEEHF